MDRNMTGIVHQQVRCRTEALYHSSGIDNAVGLREYSLETGRRCVLKSLHCLLIHSLTHSYSNKRSFDSNSSKSNVGKSKCCKMNKLEAKRSCVADHLNTQQCSSRIKSNRFC